MSDPTRPTTVAEVVARWRERFENQRSILSPVQWFDVLTLCDAADALSTAERHAAQLVELNMAWEAKARAMEEQRDAALHDLQRSREAHAEGVQMLTQKCTGWERVYEQAKAERDAMRDERDMTARYRDLLRTDLGKAYKQHDELRTANERLMAALEPFAISLVTSGYGDAPNPLDCEVHVSHDDVLRAREALTPRDPAAQGVTTLEFHHQTEDMMRDTAKAIREGIRHACEYGVDPCPQCIAEGTTPSARVARLQAEQEICTGPAPDSPAFQRLIQELDEAWADRIAEDACTVGRGIDRQTIHNPPAPEAAAPDSPALPVTRDLNSGHETNEWKLRDVTGRELPIWIGGRELADFVVAALNASTPAPEAGKPTDEERLDWLEANWMGALTRDDTFVESDGRSLRDLIDYHRARAQREREGK